MPKRSSTGTLRFRVVSSGRDEYPGDGLYLQHLDGGHLMEKDCIEPMCDDLRDGDVVEITAKVVQRMVPAHLEDVKSR